MFHTQLRRSVEAQMYQRKFFRIFGIKIPIDAQNHLSGRD